MTLPAPGATCRRMNDKPETCLPEAPVAARPAPRRKSVGVDVGGVRIGGGAPIAVQSMTNTDTADIEATTRQVAALARAGSEIVRITVDRPEAAAAVPHIRDRLARQGLAVPLVGDFHYIGHRLLAEHPACAEALAKYRINPGNVGFRDKRDRQFAAIVELAMEWGKPVRIGVNWGSLDRALLTRLMDENARRPEPLEDRDYRWIRRQFIPRVLLVFRTRVTAEFMDKAKEAGIDGFIIPDLPVEEADEYLKSAHKRNLVTVFLASPNTSEQRLEKMVKDSSGFMYLVSVYGITGARNSLEDYTFEAVKRVKRVAGERIPVGVGFGISRPEHARFVVGAGADAVIVGSAIVEIMSRPKAKMGTDLKSFALSMKKAMNSKV